MNLIISGVLKATEWTATGIFIKQLIEVGTDVLERVKAVEESKIRDPLKNQLEVLISSLEVCKKLEEKREVSFYDASGQLNTMGQAAVQLQKIINDIGDKIKTAETKSGIRQFFKKKGIGSKFEFTKFTLDLEAATREFLKRAGKTFMYVI